MKLLLRLCVPLLLLAWLPAGWGQPAAAQIQAIRIQHIGPPATSDELVRAQLRTKVGDSYLPAAVDDDVRNLYATGFFYNVQVTADTTAEGMTLTYKVQGRPRLTEIKFQGNTRFKDAQLLKKLSSKAGEPLDLRKLFTDTQELQKLYQKKGYSRTEAKYEYHLDEPSGLATATFLITESPKIKIVEVDFVGAKAFPLKKLRKVIKTRKHWMFSWLTRRGVFKEEQFEEDKEKLAEFYRKAGYIDFAIKDVQFVNPTPRTLIVRFTLFEGNQYKVGAIKFTGNKLFSTPEIVAGLQAGHKRSRSKAALGPNGLPMDVGGVFTAGGLAKDVEAIEDFYGAKGYIDVQESSRNLRVVKIPNTETGTMDLEFQIEEGQPSYIEKIEIRGNTRTKDKVIRRELAVAPGELFDMVRVKLSKSRLEGLSYFDRVEARPEPTDVPNRKNLVFDVEDKRTGNVMLGAGFSSVDALVGYVELYEGNFNLSHPFQPPWFRGGGQKLRLRAMIGTRRQDYQVTFIEPWFLDRKLQLSVDLYYHEYSFLSPKDLYDETRVGGRVGLERALGSEFLRGGVNYTLENVNIDLTHKAVTEGPRANVPDDIRDARGDHLLSRVGTSLAYDTRNSVRLPNKGQRTELTAQITTGSDTFYKLELTSAWYFRGLFPGHVLELGGRSGVAEALGGTDDVPFFERYYLGGLYNLRGFKYRYISPRQKPELRGNEPIGGDTYWFGSAEYSLPIFEQDRGIGVRFAIFYDIGSVDRRSYRLNLSDFSDNWGLGLRLNLPIGPLRLDYGFPIHHDKYNSGSGKFQFGVGWERMF
ncbi:MAG TPA: outer membrane protein assembly factor BamA [Verrucomicrobia subdivision 3 bacterium]|nr:outer membrane protein assembly factor BamA [Limisphaerales bacterium]